MRICLGVFWESSGFLRHESNANFAKKEEEINGNLAFVAYLDATECMKFSLNKIYYTPREILHFHHFSMLLWAGNLFLLLELCRDNNYNPLNIFESYLDRN